MAGMIEKAFRAKSEDFQQCIDDIELKMGKLRDVVNSYRDAERNLDQFIESGDSNYQAMRKDIQTRCELCNSTYAALQKTKETLMGTLEQMGGMNTKLGEMIDSATQATVSAAGTALKIKGVL